jgi:ATP-binding cassette subfamily F protein 3
MRARLARLLVMEPDLLLLDEPTNHLDLLSLLWLQNYLKNYPGGLLLISHDRQFMDEVVGEVHEISEKKLIAYTGNYSDYLVQREARYDQQLAAYENQQKQISALQAIRRSLSLRDLQGFAGHEQAQTNRAHGEDRATPGPTEAVSISDPTTPARRSARGQLERHPHGVWLQKGLCRSGPEH